VAWDLLDPKVVVGCKRWVSAMLVAASCVPGGDGSTTQWGYLPIDGQYVYAAYVDHGDFLVHQDDILFRPEQVLSADADIRFASASTPKSNWPLGVIPYRFADGSSASFRAEVRDQIERFNQLDLGGLWQPRTHGVPDYVEISERSAFEDDDVLGRAQLGRVGGMQTLELLKIPTQHTTHHELMHSLGFVHEQSRSDRDEFIEVNWSNIQVDEHPTYEKYPDRTVELHTVYDYGSILHYRGGENAVSPGLRTLRAKNGQALGGDSMSPLDVEGVNLRYATPKPVAPCTVVNSGPDLLAGCRAGLDAAKTGYTSWRFGSEWTCGDVWRDGTPADDGPWGQAVFACDALVDQCAGRTVKTCHAQSTPLPLPPHVDPTDDEPLPPWNPRPQEAPELPQTTYEQAACNAAVSATGLASVLGWLALVRLFFHMFESGTGPKRRKFRKPRR
jgi:hypothetical protein